MRAASLKFYPLNVQTFVNAMQIVKTWAKMTIQTPMMKKSKNENLSTLFWIYSIYLKNSYFSCFTNIPIIQGRCWKTLQILYGWSLLYSNLSLIVIAMILIAELVLSKRKTLEYYQLSKKKTWRQQKFYFSKKIFFHQFNAPIMTTSCAKSQWDLLSLSRVMTILLFSIYGLC